MSPMLLDPKNVKEAWLQRNGSLLFLRTLPNSDSSQSGHCSTPSAIYRSFTSYYAKRRLSVVVNAGFKQISGNSSNCPVCSVPYMRVERRLCSLLSWRNDEPSCGVQFKENYRGNDVTMLVQVAHSWYNHFAIETNRNLSG